MGVQVKDARTKEPPCCTMTGGDRRARRKECPAPMIIVLPSKSPAGRSIRATSASQRDAALVHLSTTVRDVRMKLSTLVLLRCKRCDGSSNANDVPQADYRAVSTRQFSELGVVPNFPVSEVSAAISKTFVVAVQRRSWQKRAKRIPETR
jgi:hypothetical protein